MEASPVTLVPCHNDPMRDLAVLSVEAGFGPKQDRAMIEAYHGPDRLRRSTCGWNSTKPSATRTGPPWLSSSTPRSPARGLPELRAGKTGALQDANERRRFRPAPERRAGGSQLHFPYFDAQAIYSPNFG